MENKHIFKLIDGAFTALEAGKVLTSLITNKINYHQMELFSNEERLGKDVLRSSQRIEELKVTKNSLIKIIDYASETGHFLQINSLIELTLVKNELKRLDINHNIRL